MVQSEFLRLHEVIGMTIMLFNVCEWLFADHIINRVS